MAVVRPLVRKGAARPKRPFDIGALDTETLGLDGKLAFVTWEHEDGTKGSSTKFNDFFKLILDDTKDWSKTIWYSHNGEYDWRYMISAFKPFSERFQIQAHERAEGVLYGLTIIDRNIDRVVARFRDSMAVFPRSLADFTKLFSPDMPKGEFDHEKVKFDAKNPAHREYAMRDVASLVNALKNYDNFVYEHFGVHLSATASGTAYQAWRHTLPAGFTQWRLSEHADAISRKSYVGGAVQLNALVKESYYNVESYDINSSYPASMRFGVPAGQSQDTFLYVPDLPGIYHARVTCPNDMIMPIIAHRGDRGLSFPTGTFETVLTSIEYEYAKTIGYDIEIIEGIFFPDGMIYPFDAYVQKCEELRAKFKGQPFESVIKQMQNSLYGRFGMKEEGRKLVIDYSSALEHEMEWSVVFSKKDPNDPDDDEFIQVPYLFAQPEKRSTEYMLPHWASWITANSRIRLDQGCRAAGIERVLYRDTDSCYIDGPPVSLDRGDAYGQWKFEGMIEEARFHAPKFYTYLKGGKWGAKCKGIPKKKLTSDMIELLHYGGDYEFHYHSSSSFISWQKSGNLGVERKRKPTDSEKVYSHQIVNGRFRPRHAAGETIPALFERKSFGWNLDECFDSG